MAKATIKCSICGANVKPKNMATHKLRAHSPEAVALREKLAKEERLRRSTFRDDLVTCGECGAKVKRENLKAQLKHAHGIGLPLKLISRRGTRVDGARVCAECGRLKTPVWHYTRSSRGEVCICTFCKPRVFNRSFGKLDALDFAQRGGGFESNRRNH